MKVFEAEHCSWVAVVVGCSWEVVVVEVDCMLEVVELERCSSGCQEPRSLHLLLLPVPGP